MDLAYLPPTAMQAASRWGHPFYRMKLITGGGGGAPLTAGLNVCLPGWPAAQGQPRACRQRTMATWPWVAGQTYGALST